MVEVAIGSSLTSLTNVYSVASPTSTVRRPKKNLAGASTSKIWLAKSTKIEPESTKIEPKMYVFGAGCLHKKSGEADFGGFPDSF